MIVCPRCEKPLDAHDRRKMSRRFFFGLGLGVAAAALINPLGQAEIITAELRSAFKIPIQVVYTTTYNAAKRVWEIGDRVETVEVDSQSTYEFDSLYAEIQDRLKEKGASTNWSAARWTSLG